MESSEPEEFVFAYYLVTGLRYEVETYDINNLLTRFEKKYFRSGHKLYRSILKNQDID